MSQTPDLRPWYKKKRYIISGLALAGIVALGSGDSQSKTANVRTVPVNTVSQVQQLPTYNPPQQQYTAPVPLSNDNSYVNTYGNTVHSPAYSENGSVPAGASAQCRDGTYSFSQSRRGTCSHHGGVARWL